MQTRVRFYITQGDDQPVVRTIPVTHRVMERVPMVERPAATVAEKAPAPARKGVADFVRAAVKRT